MKLLAESLQEFRLDEAKRKDCPECGGPLRAVPKKEWGGGHGRKRCKSCGRSFDADELDEGVADKYAAQKFGIQDPEDDFEKQYQQHKSKSKGKTAAEVNGKPIIKNPSDLSSFPNGARGVITKDGDLYIAADIEDTIHIDILRALAKKGIINRSNVTGWEDPNDMQKHGFATVQRIWNKPKFAVGESYIIPKPRHEEERKAALALFKPFFEAAKKKNPNVEFIYNTPRVAAKKSLKPEEYEKYKTMGS